MFKLQPKPTFWAKVTLNVPGEDRPAEFQAQFKHMGRAALKAYFADLEGSEDDAGALGEILVGWKGVDADFSPDNLAMLLDNHPGSAKALFEAFTREILEARAKN